MDAKVYTTVMSNACLPVQVVQCRSRQGASCWGSKVEFQPENTPFH